MTQILKLVPFYALFYLFQIEGVCCAQAHLCPHAKEYITTLEYLRTRQWFEISETQARQVASQVSQACADAAQRFIQVTRVLSQAGLTPEQSIQMGLHFSKRSHQEVKNFIAVFMQSFLKEHLDLDLKTSIQLAQSLSIHLQKNSDADLIRVHRDFERLVSFCLSDSHLNLARPHCAQFASHLAMQSLKWNTEISEPFIQTFLFLQSQKGPGLTTGQALQLAQKLMEWGPSAPENFIHAFKYGVAAAGLQLSIPEAMQFAQTLTFTQVSASPVTRSAQGDRTHEPPFEF